MSSSSTTPTILLTLKSSDGDTFLVNEVAAATKFGIIKELMELGYAGGVIDVPQTDGRIMSAMVEWCKKHTDEAATSDELKGWDAEFVKGMDQVFLSHLMLAAAYLDGTELVDLLEQKAANMIKGKN